MNNRLVLSVVIATALLLLGMVVVPENPLYGINWALASVLIIGMGILTFFWQFEKQEVNSKDIALIATMASLAAISRVPFAAIMGLQPTTFIVMITGYVFGARTGFMVGAVAALVSNFFLGQGPWTPWQMFSWGICGVIAALTSNCNRLNLISFTIITGLCGYLFGWIMNIWHWVGFVYPLNMTTFFATYLLSIPSDTIHAVGNIAFSILFGKPFYIILTRYKKKLTVKYQDLSN
ncbi:MAG: ECF transporter S component [Firmicutes bacterium HGW-Firmicutes-15]|nr:MAG: ECF transporter S component [Firmicutes bacterium HGW-Firmicutes-15]